MSNAGNRFRNKCIVFATAWMLVPGVGQAHIKNEATQFPDIEFSDARFDIVVLVGAGIIPETPVFEPDKVLSMQELATWVALAESLLRGGETPDVDALAAAAVEQGFIDSLDGDASFDDLNRLFFEGQLDDDDPDRSVTKAEAASLIAAALDTEAGETLLKKRRLTTGGSGDVTNVAITEGHHGNAYVITIGDTPLQMDEHGRVANGPTDLLQWQGRSVRRSFVRGSGDHATWIYIEAEPRQKTPTVDVATARTAETAIAEPVVTVSPADRRLLYWLIGAVLILGVALFFKRRQSN